VIEKQTTLQKELSFQGVGVHSGEFSQIKLLPAPASTGIVVRRAKSSSHTFSIGGIVPEPAHYATVLSYNNWRISTVEHVMAAVGIMRVDNVIIEIEGDEIPILDGSSLPFVQGIQRAGLTELAEPRRYLSPRGELTFSDDEGRLIRITPAGDNLDGTTDVALYVKYSAYFEHPLVGACTFDGQITTDFFVHQVAPARTFGFLAHLPLLRKKGLAKGTTLGNTVVMDEEGFLNDLRFDDEFIRHKVLDLLGDLSLLGMPLAGTVTGAKTGHNFNRQVIEHFIAHPDEWHVVIPGQSVRADFSTSRTTSKYRDTKVQ